MLKELQESLRCIKCYHSANELEILLKRAQDNDSSYLDFLDELLKIELSGREGTRLKRHLKQARFPTIKTIDDFDFKFQTSIIPKRRDQ